MGAVDAGGVAPTAPDGGWVHGYGGGVRSWSSAEPTSSSSKDATTWSTICLSETPSKSVQCVPPMAVATDGPSPPVGTSVPSPLAFDFLSLFFPHIASVVVIDRHTLNN